MSFIQRYTVETIQNGQPRPYADTVRHVRVSFERGGPSPKQIEPAFMQEAVVRSFLKTLMCGFTEKSKDEVDWFETRLDWLRPMDGKPASEVIPHGDPNQTVASVWEFHTTSPFTD